MKAQEEGAAPVTVANARAAVNGSPHGNGSPNPQGIGRPGGIPIPAGPHDWGLFGPDSVSWKVHRSPVLLVGGLRALMIQSLHPLAMAGVDQHSDYLKRPVSRMARTAQYVATVVFGDTGSAERAAAIVRRVHARVQGIDPITARPYSANDPETLLWVHCVGTHSFMAAYRAYGGGMSGSEQDDYLAEQVTAAELVGISAEDVPSSRTEYRDYFARMREHLCVSSASRDAIELCLDPPMTDHPLHVQAFNQATVRMMSTAALATMPDYALRMAGLKRRRVRTRVAALGTTLSGKVMGLSPLEQLGSTLVGKRTISLIRAATDAADAR